MRDILVDGDHHVRRAEELVNRLDGLIGAGRWQKEEHHRLGRRELLPLGHQGARSLEAGAKYDTIATPSPSLVAGGGDEEDASVGIGDEGRGRQEVRLQRQSLTSRR